MRRILPALLITMLGAAMPYTAPAAAQPPSCVCGFASVVARVLPSVVNLSVVKVQAMTPSTGETSARRLRFFGSGFIVDPSGIIVTNRHVIQDGVEITVSFTDNTQARATLLAAGRLIDLAFLKVTVDHPLPALKFANASNLQIGESVLAIGNPYGLGTSVSHGIISALNRNINETSFDNDIQTDAAINPGNSGGALVNDAGEVVGVNTALYARQNGGAEGIGYAIPSDVVVFTMQHLLHPDMPPPGWIGITGQDVRPDIAKAFGLPHVGGTILTAVAEGSPAGQAGLRPGDVILTVDGAAPVDTRALIRSVVEFDPGRKIQLAYWRDNAEHTATVTVAAWPNLGSPQTAAMASAAVVTMASSPDLGMGLATLTPEARTHYGLDPSLNGVLINLVTNNTEANERGVQAGDVIVNIDGVPVTTPEEVERLIAKAFAQQRRYLGFLIAGKNGLNWVGFYTGEQPG